MSDKAIPNIAVRENAFLRAENIPVLIDTDGSEIESKPVAALCRCGKSANKPFCDGAHKREGFDGARDDNSSRDRTYIYESDDITVHYSKLLCSHAGECGARLKVVFDPAQKPWIQPKKGPADKILEVVKACPSGALTYSLKGEAAQQITTDEQAVHVEKNGPYRVFNIPLEGETISPNGTPAKYVLCRCGLSTNKPFCDGTHHDVGWKDD